MKSILREAVGLHRASILLYLYSMYTDNLLYYCTMESYSEIQMKQI